MTIPEYDKECNCETCKEEREEKNQPQRLQEQMYLIPESLIDAGANAIRNIFKTGGLDEDTVIELNVALDAFRYASNHPVPRGKP